MIATEYKVYNMNTEEFVKTVDALRKEAMKLDGWFCFNGLVNGKEVRLKSYKCWNQIIEINGMRDSGLYDLTVKAWKEELTKAVEA